MESSVCYRCAVQRKIPSHVRVIQMMLYFVVLLTTYMGALWGAFWLLPSLGSLFLAWYLVGEARVSYEYRLDGSMLTVMRTSGMRSRQKEVEFLHVDLVNTIMIAEQGMDCLEEAERLSRSGPVKRITYDISAQDSDRPGALLYVKGIGPEAGRMLRICFQPNRQLTQILHQLCPGKVNLADDTI